MFGLINKKPTSIEMAQRIVAALFECAYINAVFKLESGEDVWEYLHLWIMKDYKVKAICNDRISKSFTSFIAGETNEIIRGKLMPPFTSIPVFERTIPLHGMDQLTTGVLNQASHIIRKQLEKSEVNEQSIDAVNKLLAGAAFNILIGAQLLDFCEG